MKKLTILVILFINLQSFATTHSVTSLGDAGAGSLRDLIVAANPGDTIDFLVAGTITLTGGQIILDKSIVIISSGPANLTLSGNSANRIFDITAGNIFIEAVSFENGQAVSNSGGAIRNASTDTVTLNNCVFNSCNAQFDGGAIVTEGFYMNIFNSTFTNNQADFDGGGIRINDGTVFIQSSTFNGNSTGFSGAGLRSVSSNTCTIINSTISGNNASGNGGGFEGDFNLINCTITGNSADNGGGAKPAGSTFQNCIIYNNSATGAGPDLDGTINSNGNNLVGDVTGSGGFASSDILGQDPMLDNLGFNGGFTSTHALMSTSPAIDAGSCRFAPSVDQRDIARTGYPDMGAYEFGGTPFGINQTAGSICAGDTYVFGTQTLDSAGVYTEIFESADGCDSTVELSFSVNQVYNETSALNICMGDTLMFGTLALFSTGVYTENFISALNCDSTVELTLTVIEPDLTVLQSGKTLNSVSGADSYQWLDCGTNQIVPNDTNQVFTALANGQYAVIVTKNGCSDTSACYNVTTVGLEENNFSSNIIVFPNLIKNQTSVRFGDKQKLVTIILMDISGREIRRQKYSETSTLILDFSSFKPGNYFIHIESEGINSVHRVVKID